jgi:hypothetical protein
MGSMKRALILLPDIQEPVRRNRQVSSGLPGKRWSRMATRSQMRVSPAGKVRHEMTKRRAVFHCIVTHMGLTHTICPVTCPASGV